MIFPKGTNIPHHIAIIPDGNRRWAKNKGLSTFQGHKKGFEVAVNLAKACREFGVHTLTFWAFSTENWQRAKKEVGYLMGLYEKMVGRIVKDALKENVRIIHIGRIDKIPKSLLAKLSRAEAETKHNSKFILNIAVDYGGKDEIIRAVNRLIRDKLPGGNYILTKEDIDKNLDTAKQPYSDPDLIIRTSGELRLSGFLLWQSEYAEFYFLTKHFPEMTKEDLKEAILEYSRRQRRYGK